MYKVIMSKKADKNIEEISGYISNELFAPDSAKKIVDKIVMLINSLSEMPERFSLVDIDRRKNTNTRKMFVENYIVIYRVDKELQNVYIYTVMYARRDFAKILNKI